MKNAKQAIALASAAALSLSMLAMRQLRFLRCIQRNTNTNRRGYHFHQRRHLPLVLAETG